MINDIQQNYKYIHNHTKIFKQIFIFFHGEAHRLIGSSLRLRVDDEPREGRFCSHALKNPWKKSARCVQILKIFCKFVNS